MGLWNHYGLKEERLAQSGKLKTTVIQPIGSQSSFYHVFLPLALVFLTRNQSLGTDDICPL